MNGHLVGFISWVVTTLLALIITLIGVILKQHQKADDEHRTRYDKELDAIDSRLRAAESEIAKRGS